MIQWQDIFKLTEPLNQSNVLCNCVGLFKSTGQTVRSPELESNVYSLQHLHKNSTAVLWNVPHNFILQQPDGCEVDTTLRWCCVQENPDPLSTSPPSGQKVSYQTDPRPHFGVAWSSHSPCRPLWGSEGPCWALRDEEVLDQTHSCPHCHLGLSPDTLRWHEVSARYRHHNTAKREPNILSFFLSFCAGKVSCVWRPDL